MDKIIEVEGLVKSYGSSRVVDNLTFSVDRGCLFAFLGTNGAGKSTTINMLTTILKQDDGVAIINGNKIGEKDRLIRKEIGVVYQNGVLDDLLTIEENLKVRGSFYGISNKKLNERIKEVSEMTGCNEFMKMKYGKLSGGQKRRADIARALINKPNILFLDEPTTGLDPETRKSIWNAIRKMQNDFGMTIFLTTHYMEEAAKSDTVTIIKKGRIIEEGTPESLKEKYTSDTLKIYNVDYDFGKWLECQEVSYIINSSGFDIKVDSTDEAMRILCYLKNSGKLTSFEMIHGSMDDVFLNIIGEDQNDKND